VNDWLFIGTLIGLVLAIVAFFAQMKLYGIDRSLKAILWEIEEAKRARKERKAE
jgi:hypothetical protein